MPNYQRVLEPGGIYFFTLVTFQRQNLFIMSEVRALFFESLDHTRRYHPFEVIAYCILPDHLHFIWEMQENDANYSGYISQIKRRFSKAYIAQYGMNLQKSGSRSKRREVTVWQRRFWEHYICDEEDLNRHIDYIHYNPVKHGLVHKPGDWEWSSFRDYVSLGHYDSDWGTDDRVGGEKFDFGE